MGRGVGGGGAGRSSGGGSSFSSRSSGGRMSSGGRGGSGSFGGRGTQGRRSPGGPMHGPYTPMGGGFRPPRRFYGGVPRGGMRRSGAGCMSMLTTVAVIAVIAVIIAFSFYSDMSSSITQSTVSRTKLDPEYSTSTELYVDELGWIRNPTTLTKGLKSFYSKTGVHPLLYITDTVNGTTSPTSSDMDSYANELYDEFCPDEGHILLLFQCLDGGTEYNMQYVCGAQAKVVMDSEACNILLDYIDSYFYSSRGDEEMFSDAFSDAAERIMNKTVSPVVYVSICAAAVILALIAFAWWKRYKQQKNLEAQQTAEILNADIHTIGSSDPELDDLEKKYKDK